MVQNLHGFISDAERRGYNRGRRRTSNTISVASVPVRLVSEHPKASGCNHGKPKRCAAIGENRTRYVFLWPQGWPLDPCSIPKLEGVIRRAERPGCHRRKAHKLTKPCGPQVGQCGRRSEHQSFRVLSQERNDCSGLAGKAHESHQSWWWPQGGQSAPIAAQSFRVFSAEPETMRLPQVKGARITELCGPQGSSGKPTRLRVY